MKKNNSCMKKIACLSLAIFGLVCFGHQASAQVLMSTVSTTSPYTNNFDTLPLGTGTSLNTSNTWVNNVTLPGWYCNGTNIVPVPGIFGQTGPGLSSICTNILGATGGSNNIAGFFSFGVGGVNPVSDRAMGSQMGNTFAGSAAAFPAIAYGIRLTNDTGVPLTNFVIRYTGEEWRVNNNATLQMLQFAYRIDSSPITSSDPANASAWTLVPTLNFLSPVTAGNTALDGNDPANRTVLGPVAISGVVVFPGQEIFLRWGDFNDSGNDHALAIDDFSVSFETNLLAVVGPPVITGNPANQSVGVGGNPSFTVTVSGASPFFNQWYATNSISGITPVGANSSTLGLTLVPLSLSGNGYFVVITNVGGSVTSSVAHLTVTNVTVVITNIAYLHTLHDANFKLNDTNTLFQIEGIVTTPVNLVTPAPASSFFIQDSSGGCDVFFRGGFGFSSGVVPGQGQHVRVTGNLDQFAGLLEFHPIAENPTHNIEVLDGGATQALPAPLPFSFETINPTYMEHTVEGAYVVVSNVFLALTNGLGQTVGGERILMTNLTGQIFILQVPNTPLVETLAQALPGAFAKSVRGVMSQAASGTGLTNGYSILWTLVADIEVGSPPVQTIPLIIHLNGTNAVLEWTDASFYLQSTPDINGTFNYVPGASSPSYTVPATNSHLFFRLINVPPGG